MKASERQNRIREIERVVATLQNRGWRMEKVTHIDESGDSFWSTISMSCDPKSTEKNVT